MMITVNGEHRTFEVSALTVQTLLETLGMIGRPVAVAKNGEVVPKSEHTIVQVREGDRIELVQAVGGG